MTFKSEPEIAMDMLREKAKQNQATVMYPSKTARHIIEDLVPEWQQMFLEKNAGYGDMAKDLGVRGQYVDIHRKVGKLRRCMWNGEEIGPESLREVLMDLIGHCFLTIDLLDE